MLAKGPVFASEDPKVLVAVIGRWSAYGQTVTEWVWLCTCGRCRRYTHAQFAPCCVSAEDHFHEHPHTRKARN